MARNRSILFDAHYSHTDFTAWFRESSNRYIIIKASVFSFFINYLTALKSDGWEKNCVENTPIYVFCILPRECDINTAAPFLRYFQTEKFSLVVSFPWNVDKYIEFSFLKINRKNLEPEKMFNT